MHHSYNPRTLTDLEIEAILDAFRALHDGYQAKGALGGLLVRVGALNPHPVEQVEATSAPHKATSAALDALQSEIRAFNGIKAGPAARRHYLETGHARWDDEHADPSASKRRIVRVLEVDAGGVTYVDDDGGEGLRMPTQLGVEAFLRRFSPVHSELAPTEGIPEKLVKRAVRIGGDDDAADNVPAFRAVDLDLDPEGFPGDDSESHYAALMTPALMTQAKEARQQVLDEAVDTYLQSGESGLIPDEHRELDALGSVEDLEPAPIPLGPLAGIAERAEDRVLLRRIVRITGWFPVITIEGEEIRVRYRFRPQTEDDGPEIEWQERTVTQEGGAAYERLTLALRAVLRNVNQDHRRDL